MSPQTLDQAFNGKRVHILGIAGTLMGAFATFLKRCGVEVTGSDHNIYPPMSDVLKKANIEVFSPYSAENVERAKPDLVIVGNVIQKINPEMQAIITKGIAYESLPSALETMILPTKHPIVIAGTHGKTTTTSMMTWMLEALGENPSFFVGGVTHNFAESFRVTDTKYFVLEGDEYDTAFFDKVPKFYHYLPKDIILTSVEYDHADIYPDMNSIITIFTKLADLLPANGNFIVCAESETPLRVARKTKGNLITYGFSENADSRATQLEFASDQTTFKWEFEREMNRETHQVKLAALGRHNVLNAMACLTLCAARGLDIKKAIAALATYKGVKRRLETFAQVCGITLIDDFAHHPTAVSASIAAIRGKYKTSRIIACFEPRSATSRRKIFQQEYAECFEGANSVYITKPYDQTSIKPDEQFSTEELLVDLKKRGIRAKLLLTTPAGVKELASDLKYGDIVVVMSNGGFDGLLNNLCGAIKK